MPLPFFYWCSYKSYCEWCTWGKKLPWQQLSSSACNSCKLTRRHTIFQSGKRCRLSTLNPTKWFTSRGCTQEVVWLSKCMNNEVERTRSAGYRSYLLVYWSAYETWCLDNPATTENPVGVSVCVCDLLCIAAVCKILFEPFDLEFKQETVKLHHASAVCGSLYVHDVCVSDAFFKRRHVLAHSSGNQQPCLYGNTPFCTPTSLALSLLTGQSL